MVAYKCCLDKCHFHIDQLLTGRFYSIAGTTQHLRTITPEYRADHAIEENSLPVYRRVRVDSALRMSPNPFESRYCLLPGGETSNIWRTPRLAWAAGRLVK